MPTTFTSLSPNIEEYHQKVQKSFVLGSSIKRSLALRKGIIYVIDSTTFQKNFKDVAEYLYDLMTDETLARSRTPFLIACNKTDLPGAKKMDVIEEHLEMELTTLSRTKAEGLASLEGHKETRVPLVKNTNEKFTFASCKHHPVTFVETSVISEDVGPVRLWLERL
nr:signal recognition particle receptor subunit [Hymenolepis microstoma]